MPKLQINISEEFAKFASSLVDERNKIQNEPRVKSANQLIPLALVALANALPMRDIPESITTEASEVLARKPGPQKKKPLESHDLFDERPGTWLSSVAIATGCAMVTCGDKSLSLAGYEKTYAAAAKAITEGWGAIPEVKKTQNDPEHLGLPGVRFIPPGTDLTPKAMPAPPPMTLADIGTWVSEASILARDQIVLADGRIIEHGGESYPRDAIRFYKATASILTSIASAQAMAYQLNWTMRREIRNSKPGILLIPPRVKLTYEIAPGRAVPVTQ